MKHIIRGFLIYLSVLSLCSAGDRSGNGGNGVFAEIKSYQQLLVHGLRRGVIQLSMSGPSAIEVINKVEIKLGRDLQLNGMPVQAINYPHPVEPVIVFDELAWSKLLIVQKKRLVLHEFAYILGYDDRDYSYSHAMYEQLQQGEAERTFQSERQVEAIVNGCDTEQYQSYDGDWSYTSMHWGMNLVSLALAKGCKDILQLQMQLNPTLGYCTKQKMSCFTLALLRMVYLSNTWSEEYYRLTPRGLRWAEYLSTLSYISKYDDSVKNDTFRPCEIRQDGVFGYLAVPSLANCVEIPVRSLRDIQLVYPASVLSDGIVQMLPSRLPDTLKRFIEGL